MKKIWLLLFTVLLTISIVSAEQSDCHQISLDSAFVQCEPKLVKIFKSYKLYDLQAYELTEKDSVAISLGVYVFGSLNNGNVLWLVSAVIDDAQINMVDAIAHYTKDEWQELCCQAWESGIDFPYARQGSLDDYIQYTEEGLIKHGRFFR